MLWQAERAPYYRMRLCTISVLHPGHDAQYSLAEVCLMKLIYRKRIYKKSHCLPNVSQGHNWELQYQTSTAKILILCIDCDLEELTFTGV